MSSVEEVSLDAAATPQVVAPKERAMSPGRRTMRRFFANRLALIGAVILGILGICAIFAPLLAPYDPNAINLRSISQPPSWSHLFGTDTVGRDTFSRALYGARISLTVGVLAVAMYLSIGFVLGALAG